MVGYWYVKWPPFDDDFNSFFVLVGWIMYNYNFGVHLFIVFSPFKLVNISIRIKSIQGSLQPGCIYYCTANFHISHIHEHGNQNFLFIVQVNCKRWYLGFIYANAILIKTLLTGKVTYYYGLFRILCIMLP